MRLFGNRFGSAQTSAGVSVGPVNQIEWITNASCIAVKSRILAAIPCGVFRKKKSGNVEKAESEPLHEVLTLEANKRTSAFQWKVSQVWNQSCFGDAYSIIDNNGFGQVIGLNQCISANVRMIILENLYELSEWDDIARPGDYAYEITRNYPYGEKIVLPESRVLHIPSTASLNGVMGIPPLTVTRAVIGLGKALTQWESQFFGKGFSPSYLLEIDGGNIGKTKIDDAIEAAHKSWEGRKSSHGLVAFPGKITQATYRLDYAMLSERQRDAVESICGWHGVPVQLIGHNWESTYNNQEQLAIQFRNSTIYPETENDRQQFDRKLLSQAQRRKGLFTAYDTKILDMQDGASWAKMMEILRQGGAVTPDEIRGYLGLNPHPDGIGSVPHVQSQNIPLSDIGKKSEQQTGGGLSVVGNEESEAA